MRKTAAWASVVSEEDLAIAIGKKGQNARLTSRLIGWKIDIMKLQTVATRWTEERFGGFRSHQNSRIDEAIAQRLVARVCLVELFDGVESGDLVEAGFTAEEAVDILKKVAAHADTQK